jgi:hypothetical protein
MRRSIALFYLIGWWAILPSVAQEEKDNNEHGKLSRFIYHEQTAVKIGYFGELGMHPGLTLGTEHTINNSSWVDVHWDVQMGGFWHRWNNTSVFARTTIGTRFPVKSLFIDLNAGAGYMHSFPAGTIYKRSSDGGVEKARNWGHPHFMPSAAILIGWNGNRTGQSPWAVGIGAETYLQSSFNGIFLPHVAAKLDVTYKFKRK